MRKTIPEMTTEELRQVMPIIIKEHSSNYNEWYETEKQNIINNVKSENIIRMNHIGSSAVEGLPAKPIIDILLEVDGSCSEAKLTENLKEIGYWLWRHDPSGSMKLLFIKGYTSADGFAGFEEKVYNLHVRYCGNWDELYFRDYLIAHPDTADEYAKLKSDILNGLNNEISIFEVGYEKAKIDFVEKYSNIAKQEFQDRYKPR